MRQNHIQTNKFYNKPNEQTKTKSFIAFFAFIAGAGAADEDFIAFMAFIARCGDGMVTKMKTCKTFDLASFARVHIYCMCVRASCLYRFEYLEEQNHHVAQGQAARIKEVGAGNLAQAHWTT